jgi:class 3 adenylate cyclase
LWIGVATGEALVGSIGSDIMMSYTVMGDVVKLASRLEGANKEYGTRNLISEKTSASAGNTVEVREIDRVVVAGQRAPVCSASGWSAAGSCGRRRLMAW